MSLLSAFVTFFTSKYRQKCRFLQVNNGKYDVFYKQIAIIQSYQRVKSIK